MSTTAQPSADATWACGLRGLAPPASVGMTLLALTICAHLLSLAMPLAIMQIYDRVIPDLSTATLTALVMGIAVAILFEALLAYVRADITAWYAARFEHQAEVAMFDRLGAASRSGDDHAAPQLIRRFAAIERIKDHVIVRGLLAWADSAFALLFIALLVLIAGPVALAPMGLWAVTLAFVIRREQRLVGLHAQEEEAVVRQLAFAMESLGHIGQIKAAGVEAAIMRRHEPLARRVWHLRKVLGEQRATGQTLQASLTGLTMICLTSAGAYGVIHGQLSLGELAASTLLANRAMTPLQRLIGQLSTRSSLSAAEASVTTMLALPAPPAAPARPAPLAAGLPSLRLENVTLGRGADGQAVLESASLTIDPGEIVRLLTPRSNRQRSLMRMIAGLTPPDQGRIVLTRGGHVCDEALLDTVAMVNTRPVIFAGTLMQNITLFRDVDPAGRARAYAVAESLGLTAFAGRLPRGFNTPVGPGSAYVLPEGQALMVTLARAIWSERPILALHNAATALDSVAAAHFCATVDSLRGKRTIILTTDRPDVARLPDRIVQIENGSFREGLAQ